MLRFKLQTGFINPHQTMTPFTLEEHILLISKLVGANFVALNVLSVEQKNIFEAQKQQNNDQRS
jgi:hypothetical protein